MINYLKPSTCRAPLVILWFVASTCGTYSQELEIKGVLVQYDTTGRQYPLEFATVALYSYSDPSMLIAGDVSKSDGSFSLKFDRVEAIVKATMIGYESYVDTLWVEGIATSTKVVDLGVLLLKQSITQLGTVEVKAGRPLVEQKLDRLVFNVNEDLLKLGNTMADLLNLAPGVLVDIGKNSIWVNGKPGAIVMFNDRRMNMSDQQLIAYLRSQLSKQLEAIEIITNPSARYDATGALPIINLRLKKSSYMGLEASLSTSYQTGKNESQFHTISLHHNVKKWRFSGFSYFNAERHLTLSQSTRLFDIVDATMYTSRFEENNRHRQHKTTPWMGMLKGSHHFNDKMFLGAELNISPVFRNREFINDETMELSVNDQLFRELSTEEQRNTHSTRALYNLHYNWRFDSLGSQLFVSLDYTTNFNEVRRGIRARSSSNAIVSEKNTDIQDQYSAEVFSALFDYQKFFNPNSRIEWGGKFSAADLDSDLFVAVDDIGDPGQSNTFLFRENILAGYFQYAGKLSKNWEFQAGLRGEYTSWEGNSLTLNEISKNRLFSLFPSVFLNKRIDDNNQVSISYSRRLKRPAYRQLNPFEIIHTPFFSSRGNTQLQPFFTDGVEVNYIYKRRYTLHFRFERQKDMISSLTFQDDENRRYVATFDNLDQFKGYEIGLRAPASIAKWWWSNTYLGFSFNGFENKADDGVFYKQNRVHYALNTSHVFSLPSNIKLQIFLLWVSPSQLNAFNMGIRRKFSFGFSKSFFENKLNMNLTAVDPLNWERELMGLDYDRQIVESDLRYLQRGVRITANYGFNVGRKVAQTRIQKSNQEALDRLR
jgi:hypothetical protein